MQERSQSSSLGSLLILCLRKRQGPLPLGFFIARTTILPPEDRPEDKHHEINPSDHHPLAPRDVDFPLPLLPLVTHLQKPLRVVRNHTIEFLFDAPFHYILLVDRPHVQRPPLRLRIADEAGSEERQYEGLLQHIEGDVGNGEELAGVGYGEADMRYWKVGKVFRAEGEELDGPATENEALGPRFEGVRRNGLNCLRDEAHDVVSVVVELTSVRIGKGREGCCVYLYVY